MHYFVFIIGFIYLIFMVKPELLCGVLIRDFDK